MRPDVVNIERLCEYLQGTCHTLQEGLDAIHPDMSDDELTDDEHRRIADEIFRCETCSWWHEAHEEDADGNCPDCSEEEEDED